MSDLTNPQSRVETILANMTGDSSETPQDPASRVEEYLYKLLTNSSGSDIPEEEIAQIVSDKVDAYIAENGLGVEMDVDTDGYLHL